MALATFACGAVHAQPYPSKVQAREWPRILALGQAAAIEALTGTQGFLADRARTFRERRDLVVAMLNAAPGVSCRKPEGAFYVFPRIAGAIGKRTPQGKIIETDLDFMLYLLDYAEVGVLHGAAYGMSPYIRIAYSESAEILREGCNRIHHACALLN